MLQLVVEGRTSAEIAGIVHLSPKTVETYRSRLMKKVGVPGQTALVKFVVEHGLTPPRNTEYLEFGVEHILGWVSASTHPTYQSSTPYEPFIQQHPARSRTRRLAICPRRLAVYNNGINAFCRFG